MSDNVPVLSRPLTSVRHATKAFIISTMGMTIVFFIVSSALVTIAHRDPADYATQLLRVTGSVAPWVVPVYVTALVAALAVLVLPDWQGRANDDPDAIDERAIVRRAIGSAAYFVGPAYAVWALLVVVAAAWPGVPVGENAGVVLAWPIILMLTVLVSRAAVGTLEQRHEDATRGVARLGDWIDQVKRLSYPGRRSGLWCLLVAAGMIAASAAIAGVILSWSYAWPTVVSCALLIVIVHAIAASAWASRYFAPSRAWRVSLAAVSMAFLAAPTAVIGTADSFPLNLTLAIALPTPALIYMVPWRGHQLLASTAIPALARRLASETAYRDRCEFELQQLRKSTRWWRRWNRIRRF